MNAPCCRHVCHSPVCEQRGSKTKVYPWNIGSENQQFGAHSTLFHEEEYSLSFCKEYISI